MDIDQNYKRLKHGIIWQYKKVIEKTKNIENIPSLKLVEVVSVKCNQQIININENLKYYTLLHPINLIPNFQMLNQVIQCF